MRAHSSVCTANGRKTENIVSVHPEGTGLINCHTFIQVNLKDKVQLYGEI